MNKKFVALGGIVLALTMLMGITLVSTAQSQPNGPFHIKEQGNMGESCAREPTAKPIGEGQNCWIGEGSGMLYDDCCDWAAEGVAECVEGGEGVACFAQDHVQGECCPGWDWY